MVVRCYGDTTNRHNKGTHGVNSFGIGGYHFPVNKLAWGELSGSSSYGSVF